MSFERSRVTRLSEACRALNRDTRHRHGTGSGSDLLLALCASRRGAKSLPPLVTPQITFNQIPPAAAGGSFNPDLQDTENTLESHRRQPVDRSILTYRTLKTLLNPTGGSRRIVQSLPVRSTTGSKGWE